MPDKETDQRFDQLAERLIHQHWDFYPTAGSRIGRHEYDGRLPDLAPDRLRRRIGELRRGLTQLSEISPRAMEPDRLLSYRLLELFLKREIFTLAEWRPLESNPIRQVGFLNVGGYVRRNYAPLADRLRAATQALDQAPDFLASLDSTLAPELGRPVLEMSIESYTGMARFYRVDLAEAVRDFHDPGILNEFNRARETAAAAIDHFAERLKARLERASADFAIGPRLYAGMLATGEGMELPLSQLEKLGQENLDHNLEQLAEVASGLAPGREVRDIVAEISRRHPTAEGLIPETRDMLEAIREAVTDLALVTIPSEDRCQVIETPTYMRYAFAAMDSPGSLETRATESFYYVTPVEEGLVTPGAGGVAVQLQLRYLAHRVGSRGIPGPLRAPPPQPVRSRFTPGKPSGHLLCLHGRLGPLHRADDSGNRIRPRSTVPRHNPAAGSAGPQLPLPVLPGHAYPGDVGGGGYPFFHGPRLHGGTAGPAGGPARHI